PFSSRGRRTDRSRSPRTARSTTRRRRSISATTRSRITRTTARSTRTPRRSRSTSRRPSTRRWPPTIRTRLSRMGPSLSPRRSFHYTAPANFHGTDSFSYSISDGSASAGPVTVSLTIASVNDAPLAAQDVYDARIDRTLTIPRDRGLLSNDSDVDGDALTAVI